MDAITIRGARENNLTGVDVDLPRGELLVFCGVSGSGKSSLAFDTLHAEGRRRYLEALAGQVSNSVGLRRPEVDVVSGLPPTIALEQRGASAHSRATVGTFSEANPVLRVLFARAGVQHDPASNEPIRPATHDEIVAYILSFDAGTRLTIESPLQRSRKLDAVGILDEVRLAGFSRVRVGGEVKRVEEIRVVNSDDDLRVVVDRIKVSADKRDRIHDAVRTAARAGRGVVVAMAGDDEHVFVDRPYSLTTHRELPPLEPSLLSFHSPRGWCPSCRGTGTDGESACSGCEGARLREEARFVRYEGHGFVEVVGWSVHEVLERIEAWPQTAVTELALSELKRRLSSLVRLGLGGLALDRSVGTLSSGEQQRLRLARAVGARLSGVLYVLDEPTAGLGPSEAQAVVTMAQELRAQGNTVLVVEHQPDMIEAADRIYEFGPGPGRLGGRIIFEGSPQDLLAGDTLTGEWLSGRASLPDSQSRSGEGLVRVGEHDLPQRALVAITGRSGTGKTRLLALAKDAVDLSIVVDRVSVRKSSRSNPATYSGLWDVMRELLAATREAAVRGLTGRSFSLNVKGGRCEVCKGQGVQRVDLQLLPDVFLTCDVCGGRRFNSDVLEVRWKGHSADELLSLSVIEARTLLSGHPKLEAVLRTLTDVGLGYVQLGQPAHTLSGGEAQRLKLAKELARGARSGVEGRFYLLDDPTVGLHPADVAVLLNVLQKLVDEGATVWMATHDPSLAAAADVRVELG